MNNYKTIIELYFDRQVVIKNIFRKKIRFAFNILNSVIVSIYFVAMSFSIKSIELRFGVIIFILVIWIMVIYLLIKHYNANSSICFRFIEDKIVCNHFSIFNSEIRDIFIIGYYGKIGFDRYKVYLRTYLGKRIKLISFMNSKDLNSFIQMINMRLNKDIVYEESNIIV